LRTFRLNEGVEIRDADGRWSKADQPSSHRYAIWHKPKGVVVTARDERKRPSLGEVLPPELAGCFAVGRLDKDSEGLLLLTDDGPWADRMSTPGACMKRYRVTFDRDPTREQCVAMAAGGELSRGITVGPCRIEPAGPRTCLIWLSEGKNRQIRRLAEREGLKVVRLQREAMGEIELGDLPHGAWRWLP
jgi:23S rRNA pseudouridine2605 synthase